MSPMRGIALKLASVFLFVIMSSLVKAASQHVPAGQAVFFRSALAMPVIVAWLALRGDLATGLRAKRPLMHAWRGLVGTTAMICNFAALALLPLPEMTVLGYASPLLTVILAAVMLGERLRLFRMSAVALGLLGVGIVLWPRLTLGALSHEALVGVGLVLTAALMSALAQIQIRRMVSTEETSAIVFYFSLTATLFSLLTIPFGWTWPGWTVIAMLVGAGLLGGVAQILLTSSYKYAGAAVIAPFEYSSILFAILFGYVFFAEAPTLPVLLGAAIVMLAGFIIIWRERQLGMRRGKARSGNTPH